VALSLPGNTNVSGFWPAAWTLGNLGRPGYGATLEGTWPYSYEACDAGTLQNQSLNGVPAFANGFSYLAGQKLSACTCASTATLGVDHPGPQLANGSFVGRSAAEIDIIEATNKAASQSAQWAPFDGGYKANTEYMTFNLTTTEFATHHNSYIVRVAPSPSSLVPVSLMFSETTDTSYSLAVFAKLHRAGSISSRHRA